MAITGRPKNIQMHIVRHNANRNMLFYKEFLKMPCENNVTNEPFAKLFPQHLSKPWSFPWRVIFRCCSPDRASAGTVYDVCVVSGQYSPNPSRAQGF
jgi:hypothetical protein